MPVRVSCRDHGTYQKEFGKDNQNITYHKNFSANWTVVGSRIPQAI